MESVILIYHQYYVLKTQFYTSYLFYETEVRYEYLGFIKG